MTNYIINGKNIKKYDKWACFNCGIIVPAITVAKRYEDDFQAKCPNCDGIMLLQTGEPKHVIRTKKK